ncbi:MAG: gamma-glutamyltransferase [Rhodospirillales bacterium]|nr:gamma-glutamyltransferase [Rhodospirillales bacterium]MBO6786189.1 gamma-glutamyltransferase [Rhodospirillales bacterium]
MTEARAMITAEKYAISAGHELATRAGLEILENGGNAVDAGVAAGMALGVLHCDLVNFAGVAPIMIRMADSGETVTIDGLGHWPQLASVAFFENEYGGEIPQGLLRTVVPAAPAAWITALDRFGTMSFKDVAQYAWRYACDGFPVYPVFARFIADNENAYHRTPACEEIYLPGGRPPAVGDIFVQEDLASTIRYMIDCSEAAGSDRKAGLQAAYDAFYKGDIAKTITDYHIANGGFLRMDDMSGYKPRFEAPIRVGYGNAEIFTCGAWCQGISLAQAFRMLDGIDVAALGHNSADYIHTLSAVFDLVFADRDAYVADPAFVDVPVREMLDDAYLAARRSLIEAERAFAEMPPAGDPRRGLAKIGDTAAQGADAAVAGNDPHDTDQRPVHDLKDTASADTTYVCVMDEAGNMFSATPSDTSADTEVIPGTGLCPSSRGSQSRGVASSINAVEPGKRPRLTPNPAIALKDGQPLLAFGTPGGDVQIQAMIQVFINAFEFGMDIQKAVEAPRFATYNFPSSFAPHTYHPGLVMLEESIPAETTATLDRRGRRIDRWADGTWKAGGVLAVRRHGKGTLTAGADPRRAGFAAGR